MSSLRVTSLRGRTGNQSPTLPDGAVVTGVTTSTSFDGSGASLTDLNATQLTSGTIPDWQDFLANLVVHYLHLMDLHSQT